MPRSLNIKKFADGVRIIIDDDTRGRDMPLPISPSPFIRYDNDANIFSFDIAGVEERFNADDDNITFNDLGFSGDAAQASAVLRDIFFLPVATGTGGEGGLSEAEVDARADARIASWVGEPPDSLNTLTEIATLLNSHDTAIATKLDQAAVDARADARISNWVGAAPTALDTLLEIANELADQESTAAALTTAIAAKAPIVPASDNTQDLGTSANRYRKLYTVTEELQDMVIKAAAAAAYYGHTWRDQSNNLLGRMVQHNGTGNILLESHANAGTPEIQILFDTLTVVIRKLETQLGATINKNVNDALAALTVNQMQGTGDLLNLKFNGTTMLRVLNTGSLFAGADGLAEYVSFEAFTDVTNKGAWCGASSDETSVYLSAYSSDSDTVAFKNKVVLESYSGNGLVVYEGTDQPIFFCIGDYNPDNSVNQFEIRLTGLKARKNTNDANTAFTINQQQGTGKIADFQFAGASKASVDKDGHMVAASIQLGVDGIIWNKTGGGQVRQSMDANGEFIYTDL